MSRGLLFFILFIVGLIILYIIYKKNFKNLVFGVINLVTGGVKTGKSLLCSTESDKEFRKRHRSWWISINIFRVKDLEEPLYYTNVYHTFGNGKKPHRLDKCIRIIELEHLLRKKRFNYRSVVYIQESSLMADNMDYKNEKRNAQLSLFNKLFGHETRGGILFYDTQCIEDNHYSIKRVVSTYFFIQKSINFWLFRVLYVREMINTDLGNNNFETDVDNTMRKVLVFRWWYKHYDRYYFAYTTDNLTTDCKELIPYDTEIVSFNPLYRKLTRKDYGYEKENFKNC